MTPEEIESELKHLATKADVADLKAEMHKELHALTWRILSLMLTLMTAQTGLILGAMYYMLTHVK
jgi:hypothetical protein